MEVIVVSRRALYTAVPACFNVSTFSFDTLKIPMMVTPPGSIRATYINVEGLGLWVRVESGLELGLGLGLGLRLGLKLGLRLGLGLGLGFHAQNTTRRTKNITKQVPNLS
jgi:hypothetical protein